MACSALEIGYCLQGRFVDGSPFQAATGKSGDLTKEASDALEAAGFHRLGGACLLMRMPAQAKRPVCLHALESSGLSHLKRRCDS